MNAAQADIVVQAALAEARRLALRITVVVCDAGGTLVAARRMDKAPAGTVAVAMAKAACAANFRRPTRAFAERVANGEGGVVTLPGVIALAGGIPVLVDDVLLGAVGVSGASPEEDEAIALAGLVAADLGC